MACADIADPDPTAFVATDGSADDSFDLALPVPADDRALRAVIAQTRASIETQRVIVASLRALGDPVDAAVGELNRLEGSLAHYAARLDATSIGR